MKKFISIVLVLVASFAFFAKSYELERRTGYLAWISTFEESYNTMQLSIAIDALSEALKEADSRLRVKQENYYKTKQLIPNLEIEIFKISPDNEATSKEVTENISKGRVRVVMLMEFEDRDISMMVCIFAGDDEWYVAKADTKDV